jgi:predicted CXXCH cytochrome family protein
MAWAAIGVTTSWLALGALRAELPPDRQVDQLRVCLECHDLARELSSPVRHPPAAEGDCAACHNPHVARFDKLLKDQPAPLCVTCHSDLERELERPYAHRPVAEGRCADCHQPHGSTHRALLREPGAALCASCHETVGVWRQRRVQHAPFAQGQCARCHQPHAAEAAGLLVRSGAALCVTCHAANDAFRAAHRGYPVERASCATCHDPHASARRGMLRETVHPPFADGTCDTCHVGGRAADPFRLVATEGELCGSCHEAAVEASRQAVFPHLAGGGGRCSACHNPHAGEGAAMLRQTGDATCLGCHDPGGASSGQLGRYATHAGDLGCVTCHAPHGGERPQLFARDPIAVCGDCHSHQHGVAHPIGETTLDPRNGQPMDCGSCHGVHEAPYAKYLHASDERDLCIGCHKGVGRRP